MTASEPSAACVRFQNVIDNCTIQNIGELEIAVQRHLTSLGTPLRFVFCLNFFVFAPSECFETCLLDISSHSFANYDFIASEIPEPSRSAHCFLNPQRSPRHFRPFTSPDGLTAVIIGILIFDAFLGPSVCIALARVVPDLGLDQRHPGVSLGARKFKSNFSRQCPSQVH